MPILKDVVCKRNVFKFWDVILVGQIPILSVVWAVFCIVYSYRVGTYLSKTDKESPECWEVLNASVFPIYTYRKISLRNDYVHKWYLWNRKPQIQTGKATLRYLDSWVKKWHAGQNTP